MILNPNIQRQLKDILSTLKLVAPKFAALAESCLS